MTRKSKREIERALETLDPDTQEFGDPCDACGGYPEGADLKAGLTAPFSTIECTCNSELPEGCRTLQHEDLGQGSEMA